MLILTCTCRPSDCSHCLHRSLCTLFTLFRRGENFTSTMFGQDLNTGNKPTENIHIGHYTKRLYLWSSFECYKHFSHSLNYHRPPLVLFLILWIFTYILPLACIGMDISSTVAPASVNLVTVSFTIWSTLGSAWGRPNPSFSNPIFMPFKLSTCNWKH